MKSKRLHPQSNSRIVRRCVLVASQALVTIALCQVTAISEPDADGYRWWKGNLHTHSLWSDGDQFPEVVVDWYVRHGYQFLALSDHNVLLRGDRLRVQAFRWQGGTCSRTIQKIQCGSDHESY